MLARTDAHDRVDRFSCRAGCFSVRVVGQQQPERCRKLELLLLTRVTGTDFWRHGGGSQAGKGYFTQPCCSARRLAHPAGASMFGALAAASFCGCFISGFRRSRAKQWREPWLLLTIGLPVLAYAPYKQAGPTLTALVPPGSRYMAGCGHMLYLGVECTGRHFVGADRRPPGDSAVQGQPGCVAMKAPRQRGCGMPSAGCSTSWGSATAAGELELLRLRARIHQRSTPWPDNPGGA